MMPCVTLLVPLKVQSLGLSAAWLGWCEAGLSLGMLVGSLGPPPGGRACRAASARASPAAG